MADAQRTTGPIDAPASTRGLLASLRVHAGVTGTADLQLQDLADVEMAFAARFPDALLAVWAAAVPSLCDVHRMRVTSVVGLTARLLEHKVRADLVCVGRDGDRFLCVEKHQTAPGCELVVVDVDDKTTETVQLDEWLEGKRAALGAAMADGGDGFVPRIVRPLPAASSGTRVKHPKFGEGNVLREIGDGPTRKLQIDFPKFGLKMLQARFVEYID